MADDYLWDMSGEPDTEVRQLETTLASFRWQGFNAQTVVRRPWPWWQFRALIAALPMLVAIIGIAVSVLLPRVAPPRTSWTVSLEGAKPSPFRPGEVVKTTPGSHGQIESAKIGRIEMDPESQLRLVGTRESEQRFALDRGTIHALIWAPPAQFIVDTPSAHAIDLGCQYTLRVAKDGSGFLSVETGWVAFDWHNVESFIPSGAACKTRRDRGPGTPYYLDAPQPLITALDKFDASGNADALRSAVALSRPRDALTLWHLMSRTQGNDRAQVAQAFTERVRLPATVSREGLLAGDRKALDQAWDALDVGSTQWWRTWKRRW